MQTIAIANQKGGCGKTTTAINLAAAMAELGKSILLVDLDAQAHSTLGFGVNPDELDMTMYDVLSDETVQISRVIVSSTMPTLSIAPSNIMLSGIEVQLSQMYEREHVLQKELQSVAGSYDYCLIDCSPSLSILTLNALVASNHVVIPVQTHYYALEGLKQLVETLRIVQQRFNPELKILGLLLTFVDNTTLLSKDVQEQMRKFFGDLVFDTVIHRTVRLAEAPSSGEPVIKYAPHCKGSAEYRALAEEVTHGKAKSRTAEERTCHI